MCPYYDAARDRSLTQFSFCYTCRSSYRQSQRYHENEYHKRQNQVNYQGGIVTLVRKSAHSYLECACGHKERTFGAMQVRPSWGRCPDIPLIPRRSTHRPVATSTRATGRSPPTYLLLSRTHCSAMTTWRSPGMRWAKDRYAEFRMNCIGLYGR